APPPFTGQAAFRQCLGMPPNAGVPFLSTCQTADRIPAARLRPSLVNSVALRKTEGAGNAGCTPHPLPCVQNKKTHAGQHRYAEITPALPAQWLYGLLRALPGVPGLLAPIAAQSLARLDPSVGGSGPHGLTVRDCAARLAAQRVHRNPRRASWRSRNVLRNERGMASLNHNFCLSERRIFLREGLDIAREF